MQLQHPLLGHPRLRPNVPSPLSLVSNNNGRKTKGMEVSIRGGNPPSPQAEEWRSIAKNEEEDCRVIPSRFLMGSLVVALVVAACVVPISIFVNHVIPEPYMDEIFHVPPAQRYCKGDFSTWDPMITTLSGLYYVSLAYVASLFPGMWWSGLAASFPDLCSTAVLSSINIALSIICSLLFYEICIQLKPDVHTMRATAWALVLALYPLHWFFTFLFYTDVDSTTAVMAMYLACLKRSYWLSALLGCLSIILPQTNVVWTVFIVCIGVMDYVEEFGSRNISIGLKTDAFAEATSESIAVKQKLGQTNLRKRQNVSSEEIANNTVIGGDPRFSYQVRVRIRSLVCNALVDMYIKCGSTGHAREVFDRMSQRDAVSWTAMITRHAQNGLREEALKLFGQMQLAGVKPDVISWTSTGFGKKTCCNLPSLQ